MNELRARSWASDPGHLGWLLARVRASRVATRCSGWRSKGRHHERGCAPGRPGARSSGAWTTVVVPVDRIGCRSRFEASGPTSPTGDESVTRSGSSSRGASRWGEPTFEAAPTVAKPRRRWRVPASRGAETHLGTSSRRKALWVVEVVALDGAVVEAALAPVAVPPQGGLPRQARQGAPEVRSSTSLAVENAAATEPQRGPNLRVEALEDCERIGRSWDTPSSVCPLGVGLPQGGPAPQRAARRESGELGRSARERARESNDARVLETKQIGCRSR